MRNYQIYFKKDGKRVVINSFSAETDEMAIAEVDSLKRSQEAVKEYGKNIFWDYADGICVLDENGDVVKKYNSFEEQASEWREEEKKWSVFKKAYYWVVRTWNKYDPWFNVKLGFERMFKGYDRRVAWNIDVAVFDLIRYSVRKLIDNMHGCPSSYCQKARKILENLSDEELEESFKTRFNSSKRELNVAMALYRSDLENLIENINVADYYGNHGIQEPGDKNWVDEHKYPIPHLKNSEVIDYKKLGELEEKKLDEIFDYLRHNIRSLWD